jgi:signal transduction histidine kinase
MSQIRTPMNAIIDLQMFCKIRIKQPTKECERLKPLKFFNVIINDILDLAKVNAGKMNLKKIHSI